jgi:hypothetical protein
MSHGRRTFRGLFALALGAAVAAGCGTPASVSRPIVIEDGFFTGRRYLQDGRQLSNMDIVATFPDEPGARRARWLRAGSTTFAGASLLAFLYAQGSANAGQTRGALLALLGGFALAAPAGALEYWVSEEAAELVANHAARLRGDRAEEPATVVPFAGAAPAGAGRWTGVLGLSARF